MPHVFVGVGREQHHFRGLKEFLAVADIERAGDLAVVVRKNSRDVRTFEDGQVPGLLRGGNGRDRGRVLGLDVASAGVAVAVIGARRTGHCAAAS